MVFYRGISKEVRRRINLFKETIEIKDLVALKQIKDNIINNKTQINNLIITQALLFPNLFRMIMISTQS